MMVKTLLPGCLIDTPDAADALAVAICHAHQREASGLVAQLARGGRVIAKLSGTIDLYIRGLAYHRRGGWGTMCSVPGARGMPWHRTGGKVSLYIETHVREDHIHLFGFRISTSRPGLSLLTTVQGVGAKVALAMLSVIAPDALAQAIAAQDKTVITQAPGVGPNWRPEIMTELKDKMGGIAWVTGLLLRLSCPPMGPLVAVTGRIPPPPMPSRYW